MNNIHPIFREALAPFAPVDADRIKVGHALRQSANDEPSYIRTPELDKRIERGDVVNANAWFETATGRNRYFCVGYDAGSGQWLAITAEKV